MNIILNQTYIVNPKIIASPCYSPELKHAFGLLVLTVYHQKRENYNCSLYAEIFYFYYWLLEASPPKTEQLLLF